MKNYTTLQYNASVMHSATSSLGYTMQHAHIYWLEYNIYKYSWSQPTHLLILLFTT